MADKQKASRSKAADDLPVDVIRSEVPDDVLQKVIAIVLGAIDKHVLTPTAVTMNDEEYKLLEREVERQKMVPISQQIKQELDEQVGPTFHVVYGRSYGLHVTHERCNFVHIRVDDADVVVWKHGE